MAPILPKKKREILEYLQEVIKSRGYAPTLSEIAQHFHVSSLATIHEHLQFLEKKGFIQKGKNDPRSISIVNQSETADIEQMGMLLPLVGVIAAGSPIEAEEDIIEKISIPEHMAKESPSYILRVKGDSMIDNFILDDDYVVVKKTDMIKNGDTVVAVLEDGTATLKEFYKEKNGVRLQPANQLYKPLFVHHPDIQGKVIGVLRNYA
ncbi:MAG: transcriptional repressor LexA [Patescibacteria group bacterium]|jgi:repressor LexA